MSVKTTLRAGDGGGEGERGGLGGSEKNREIFLAPLPLEEGLNGVNR